MRRTWIAACVISAAVVAAGLIVLTGKGPPMIPGFLPTPSPEEMYPAAPAMPPIVAASAEDLLSRYEEFLRAKAPAVFSSLQAGLSDAAIDALEKQHAFVLPADLRALYRWRNGTATGVDAFPDHRFVPVDLALSERDVLREQVRAGTPEHQRAYAAFCGHRDAWLGLVVDLAGDGYFLDPGRSESRGSFFFCFAEDGSYVFYPSFRNYLAAVVDGQEAGVFVAGAHGVETADFAKAQELWAKYGASPRR